MKRSYFCLLLLIPSLVMGQRPTNPLTPGATVFLSPTGNDANVGTHASPKATMGAAINALTGKGTVILKAGTYSGVKLDASKVDNLTIMGEPGRKVTVRFGEAVTTFTQDSGIRWKATISSVPDAALQHVFKIDEPEGLIPADERHPLHRGRVYRLPHKRLVHASSKADVLSGNGRWWFESGTLYLSAPDGGNPNGATYQVPSPSHTDSFVFGFTNAQISIEGIRVEFAYQGFNLSGAQNYELRDCESFGSSDIGISAFDTSAGRMLRCESAANSNDGIVVGSNYGLVAYGISRTTEAQLVDVYVHDNWDKGFVAHERGSVTIEGGLFEYQTTQSGIMAFGGGEITIAGATTRKNVTGIVAYGPVTTGEGGTGIAIYANNCYSDNDTYSWWTNAAGDMLDLVNCIAKPATSAAFQADGGAILRANSCTVYTSGTQSLAIGSPTFIGLQIIGPGTPEGAIGGPIGSRFLRTNGGVGTTLYVKQSGAVGVTTGWGAPGTGGGGLAHVVEDTTPQLGGNLDLNGHIVTGLVIGTNVLPVTNPVPLHPNSAMGALAVDVTKRNNTKSVSTDSPLTFSGTPGTGATFGLTLTNTDTAAHTITIPSSYSLTTSGARTSFPIAAGEKLELSWRYDGTTYFLAGDPGKQADVWIVAVSDETTDLTTGTAKATFRAPRAATVTGVRASVNTVSSSGLPTFDINEGGTTILSTKLTIDASEKTSVTAATAAVISDSAIADDAEMTIDIDTAGTGAKGAKVAIYVQY